MFYFKNAAGLFFLFMHFTLSSQTLFDFSLQKNCSYYGEKMDSDVYGFASSKEAISIVDEIVQKVGLVQNFEIKAASVPNAAAVIEEGQRYILYSENFIQSVKAETGSKWSSISILAHEIGHHLNGHTLKEGGSRPVSELEADKFSGFILAKMGATLKEAQSAIMSLENDEGSFTHPPKRARLEAIAVGFREGTESIESNLIPSNTIESDKIEEPSSFRNVELPERTIVAKNDISKDEVFKIVKGWCKEHFSNCFTWPFLELNSIDSVRKKGDDKLSITGTNFNSGYGGASHKRAFKAELTFSGNSVKIYFEKEVSTFFGTSWDSCTKTYYP